MTDKRTLMKRLGRAMLAMLLVAGCSNVRASDGSQPTSVTVGQWDCNVGRLCRMTDPATGDTCYIIGGTAGSLSCVIQDHAR